MIPPKYFFILLFCLIFSDSYAANLFKPQIQKGDKTMEQLKLESTEFKEGEMIPARFTCDGENVSPRLRWSNVPAGTKSLALVAEDPDASSGSWVHWVMFNIPAEVTELAEKIPSVKTLPNGSVSGANDFRKFGYGGPCPPSGTHRYFFRIYALDTTLSLEPGASKKQVLDAIRGHILSQGELMGKYRRK
jgi:Raf kinase inhibitor-like YbhB/YbcL family protein